MATGEPFRLSAAWRVLYRNSAATVYLGSRWSDADVGHFGLVSYADFPRGTWPGWAVKAEIDGHLAEQAAEVRGRTLSAQLRESLAVVSGLASSQLSSSRRAAVTLGDSGETLGARQPPRFES